LCSPSPGNDPPARGAQSFGSRGQSEEVAVWRYQRASRKFVEQFALVINSGTTEQLLNQCNAFKVMHDATRMGGSPRVATRINASIATCHSVLYANNSAPA
jgi:hypothetical protein